MKTSKLTAVELKKQLEYGKVYKVALESGDMGEETISNKENYVPKVGDEWMYNIEESQYGPKIKRAGGKSGGKPGGFPRGPEPFKVSSMSMAYAKDLVVSGKVDLKDLSLYAQKFYDWIKERE